MFDDAGRAAYIISQTACAQAEIAGMQAENAYCLSIGEVLKYDLQAFQDVSVTYGISHNQVTEFLRAGR